MKIQEERDDAWDLEEDDEEGGITLESWGMDLEFRISHYHISRLPRSTF